MATKWGVYADVSEVMAYFGDVMLLKTHSTQQEVPLKAAYRVPAELKMVKLYSSLQICTQKYSPSVQFV